VHFGRASKGKGSAISSSPDEREATAANGQKPRPPVTTGLKRIAFVGVGLACVGMAYLGVFLPGLPATPWVLLAGYFFARSSPRLERWLKRSPVFGRLLRDWDEHRGIRLWVKVLAVILVAAVVTLSITLGNLPVWAKWIIGALAAIGVCVIVFVVPTIRNRAV
jgi:uncharacterized membrane protein YbaN (DUF454 family)